MWKLWTPRSNAAEQSQRVSEPQAGSCLQAVFSQSRIGRWSSPSDFYQNICIYYFLFLYSKKSFSIVKPTNIVSSDLSPSGRFFINRFCPCSSPRGSAAISSSSIPDRLQSSRFMKLVGLQVVYMVITAVLKCWLETLKNDPRADEHMRLHHFFWIIL